MNPMSKNREKKLIASSFVLSHSTLSTLLHPRSIYGGSTKVLIEIPPTVQYVHKSLASNPHNSGILYCH